VIVWRSGSGEDVEEGGIRLGRGWEGLRVFYHLGSRGVELGLGRGVDIGRGRGVGGFGGIGGSGLGVDGLGDSAFKWDTSLRV
jgi:hypothetical protein